VAFLHGQLSLPQEVLVVDRHGQVRALSSLGGRGGGTGLSWTPSSKEVWVSTTNAIWASRLSGSWKLVYQGVYEMQLEDISRTGTVLVDAQDSRRDLGLIPPDAQHQRQLSWTDRTDLGALSDDGRQVVFTAYSNQHLFTFIEPTTGSPPVKLGRGHALALSHDGKWVLSRPDDYREPLSVLPVGPGNARTVSVDGLEVSGARWFHDGTHIVFMGRTPQEKQSRLHSVALDNGTPKRISETAVNPYYVEVSNDDRFVAARDLDGIVTLFPVDGGAPVPLLELGKDVVPAGWTVDGQLWVRSRDVPSRMLRYDIRSRRPVEERTVSPSDPTGVSRIPTIRITPDGRTVAFDYERTLSYLYLLEGLSAAGR